MKIIATDMRNHIYQEARTLCTCVRVIKRRREFPVQSILRGTSTVVTFLYQHNFQSGNNVRFENFTGLWAGLNGDFQISVVSDYSVSVSHDSTAYSPYDSDAHGGDGYEMITFTDHDQSITYSGIKYDTENNAIPTSIKMNDGMGVDNAAMQVPYTVASKTEIMEGELNGADVEIFKLNYADLSMGMIKMMKGNLGQLQINDYYAEAEIKGLKDFLRTPIGDLYSVSCRAIFGDDKCTVDIEQYKSTSIVDSVTSRYTFSESKKKYSKVRWNIVTAPYIQADTVDMQIYGFEVYSPDGTPLCAGGVGQREPGTRSTPYTADEILVPEFFGPNRFDAYHGQYIGWIEYEFASPVEIGSYEIGFTDWGGIGNVAFEVWNGTSWVTIETIDPHLYAVQIDDTYTTFASKLITTREVDLGGNNEAHYYDEGLLVWRSGLNTGTSTRVRSYTGGVFTLVEPMLREIQVGDLFDVYAGCSKTIEACKGFNNVNNFRGEPWIPGREMLQVNGRII